MTRATSLRMSPVWKQLGAGLLASLILAGPAVAQVPAATASDSAATPPAVAPPAAEDETPQAKALRSALARQDSAAVLKLIPDAKSAMSLWLLARIDDHLNGRALATSWTIGIEPVMGPASDLRWLRVRGRLLSGSDVESSAMVRLLAGNAMQPLNPGESLSLPIQGHTLEVALAPDSSGLTGVDTLDFNRRVGRTFGFRLSSQLAISAIQMGATRIPFQREGDTVYVTLPAGAGAGKLTVRFGGTWSAGPYDFVGPRTTLLRPESQWYPQPLGPTVPARFAVTVKAPAGLTAVASGPLVNGQYQPVRAVNGVTVMAGRWQVRTRKVGKVNVRLLVMPDSLAVADTVLAEAAGVIDFCEQRLGSYPYDTLTIAETDVAGGYGGQGVVSLGSRVIVNKRSRSTFLAHEIIHSWTDRLLARGTEGEIGFLSEGLTTYLAYQYVMSRPGSDAPGLRQSMTLDYMRFHGKAEDVAIRDAQLAAGTSPWFGLVYQKGAMALHDLYRYMGDKRYWLMMKNLFTAFADKPVTVANLRTLAEKTGDESLAWWFGQWIERSGSPQLALQGVQVEPSGTGYRVFGTVTQTGSAYRLKVPMLVTTPNGDEKFQLTLMRGEQPFSVIVPTTPLAVRIDPDYQILTSRRRPPTLATEKSDTVLIVSGTQGQDLEERQAAQELTATLSSQYQAAGKQVTFLTDVEATQEQLAAAPLVLLVGRPGLNSWTAKLTEMPVSLANDRFVMAGVTYDKPSQGIVQAMIGPWRDNQVVAVYGGLGAPAMRQMAKLKLGIAPIEVVVAGEDRVVEAGSYPLADPELNTRLP